MSLFVCLLCLSLKNVLSSQEAMTSNGWIATVFHIHHQKRSKTCDFWLFKKFLCPVASIRSRRGIMTLQTAAVVFESFSCVERSYTDFFPPPTAHFFSPPCPTGWRKCWKSWACSPPLAPINANVSSFCRVFGFSLRCFGPLLWKTQLSESESGDRAVTQPELTTSLFPRWGHGGCRQPERNHTAAFVIHVSNLTVLLTRHLQSCSRFEKTQTWNYSFQWVVDHYSDSSEHLLMKHLVRIGSEVLVYKVLPNPSEFKLFKNIKAGITLLIFKVVIEDVEIILGVL